MAVALGAAAPRMSLAQDAYTGVGSPPELAAREATVFEAVTPRKPGVNVDVLARFEEFQRDFARDFGVKAGNDSDAGEGGGGDAGSRFGEAFVKRWEGSAAYRWYERMLGVYDRFEGLYERIESSTRWATSGFEVDPDLEAAVDGKLRLHVDRDVGRFDVGLNVDNALDGRLGLRLGGTVKGYKFGFGVSDVVNDGRLSVQVRKTTK